MSEEFFVTPEVEIMELEEFSKQVDGENGLVLVRINRNLPVYDWD